MSHSVHRSPSGCSAVRRAGRESAPSPLKRRVSRTNLLLQGTAEALEELQVDAAVALQAAAAAAAVADDALGAAAARRHELEGLGRALTGAELAGLQALELAAQRAVLLRDARAHDAQAISKQVRMRLRAGSLGYRSPLAACSRVTLSPGLVSNLPRC